jgi:hypothetical protein
VTTLREITPDHIEAAVADLSGQARRKVAVSLRSLFKPLKRERMVFRNPARQLSVGYLKGIPQSVPSDHLAGLLDQAKTPLGRLVIALVAIHALPGEDLRTILTTDLSLARSSAVARFSWWKRSIARTRLLRGEGDLNRGGAVGDTDTGSSRETGNRVQPRDG